MSVYGVAFVIGVLMVFSYLLWRGLQWWNKRQPSLLGTREVPTRPVTEELKLEDGRRPVSTPETSPDINAMVLEVVVSNGEKLDLLNQALERLNKATEEAAPPPEESTDSEKKVVKKTVKKKTAKKKRGKADK